VGPADVDVAELHDCFSITEVQLYEALGFAAEGQGTRLLREGVTERGGRLPVNTGGGLISFGHPVGATGVKQVLEVHRQLKGKCGDYQVARPLRTGLSANIGGDDRTAVVVIQRG
jgi:acetyl-CoA acyltransferase